MLSAAIAMLLTNSWNGYRSEPRLSFCKTVVVRYRMYLETRHLAPGTINLRLGAVRRLAYEASDCGLLSADLAAGIRRVKGVKKLGVRLGNWLTAEQAHALWQAPDPERLKGNVIARCLPFCWLVDSVAMNSSVLLGSAIRPAICRQSCAELRSKMP